MCRSVQNTIQCDQDVRVLHLHAVGVGQGSLKSIIIACMFACHISHWWVMSEISWHQGLMTCTCWVTCRHAESYIVKTRCWCLDMLMHLFARMSVRLKSLASYVQTPPYCLWATQSKRMIIYLKHNGQKSLLWHQELTIVPGCNMHASAFTVTTWACLAHDKAWQAQSALSAQPNSQQAVAMQTINTDDMASKQHADSVKSTSNSANPGCFWRKRLPLWCLTA